MAVIVANVVPQILFDSVSKDPLALQASIGATFSYKAGAEHEEISFVLPVSTGNPLRLELLGEGLPTNPLSGFIGTVSILKVYDSVTGDLQLSVNGRQASVGLAELATQLISGNPSAAANLFLAGRDTVFSRVSLSLADFPLVEDLTLLSGASGAIIAAGNAKANKLVGNEFANRLVGEKGPDVLTGKLGADVFALGARSKSLNKDTADAITDFSGSGLQGDTIEVSRSGYGIAADRLNEFRSFETSALFGKLTTGAAARSSELFVYNEQTGLLYLNMNGTGDGFGGAGGVIVKLRSDGSPTPPALGNFDIQMVA